jgi:hypothetical protein
VSGDHPLQMTGLACPEKVSRGRAQKKVSFEPRCEGMGTSVSSRLSPSCRSLLARPQINASRTQCALRPISPMSFVSKARSLSCLRTVLVSPENQSVRSARDRRGNRGLMKSPISMSVLPGHHVEANPAHLEAARAPAGDQTFQMQVCMPSLALIRGTNRIGIFHFPRLHSGLSAPLL